MSVIRSLPAQYPRRRPVGCRIPAIWWLLIVLPVLLFGVGLSSSAMLLAVEGTNAVNDRTATGWQLVAVDAPRWFEGMGPRSLALDAAGNVHVAYGGDHLYYARWDAPGWLTQLVDDAAGTGRYASLALDQTGQPHIGYFDSLNRRVSYAHRAGDTWLIERVEEDVELIGSLGLALDGAGRPHLAYYDNRTGALRYASRDINGWLVQTADEVGGADVALSLDASGRPHIAYGWETLKYARLGEGGWEIEMVADTTGRGKSLVLDSSGRPHIAYEAVSVFKTHELRYAWRTRAGWNVQVIDSNAANDAGFEPSLALDQTGAPRISYGAFDSLKYARWTGSEWVRERVDRSPARFTALALDINGKPKISYLAGNSLKVAQRPGLDWQVSLVDSRRSTGAYTSLAVDLSGRTHIGYRDLSAGVLRYATKAGAGWHSVVVDSAAGPAANTVLASDRFGNPHLLYISYVDPWQSAALRYARLTGNTWVIQTVVPDIGSGDRIGFRRPALQVDGDGAPHVAYYDGVSESILYSRWDGSQWLTEPVAGPGYFGECVSLALDVQGSPSVLYQENDRGDLILASWDGQSWQQSVVDSGFYGGGCNGLVLDQTGTAHVCYAVAAGATVDLRYAQGSDSNWQVTTVQVGAPATGDFCAVALDSRNTPHISFYDAARRDLLHAWRADGLWQVETVVASGDVGAYSSLALAADDTIYISYHDATAFDLKVAFWSEVVPPATATPTATATSTAVVTPIATATATATVTATLIPTLTASPTASPSPSPSPTTVFTVAATDTPAPTATSTPTASATSQPTETITPAATATATPGRLYLPLITR